MPTIAQRPAPVIRTSNSSGSTSVRRPPTPPRPIPAPPRNRT